MAAALAALQFVGVLLAFSAPLVHAQSACALTPNLVVTSTCFFAPGTYNYQSITVNSNQRIIVHTNAVCSYVTLLVSGNVTINSNAFIEAPPAISGGPASGTDGAGASFGGRGGSSTTGTNGPGPAGTAWIDSPNASVVLSCGSAGGAGSGVGVKTGGRGGGVINIVLNASNGAFMLNGGLIANGEDALGTGGGGGKLCLCPTWLFSPQMHTLCGGTDALLPS
jgi:hypothetical protein